MICSNDKFPMYLDGHTIANEIEMIEHHDKYIDQGYCSINEKDIIEKAYTAYHNLGGNGAITTYYNQIMSLPDRKE